MLQSTAAAAERVFEFLNEEEEIAETENPVPVRDRHGKSLIQGQVTFENVHFGYNPDKIIINDFSMFINAGKRVAIVGPTGAGKTTIGKRPAYCVSGSHRLRQDNLNQPADALL